MGSSGNYIPPSGGSVIITDNINGTTTIDNGSTPQDVQSPILEQTILVRSSIDPNADYDDVWDASAGRMARVLSTRASQSNYLADGANDTRAGNIGSIGTSIYAAWDHIHPISAITAPATPTLTVTSGTMIITPTLVSTVTEEESVTFNFTVRCDIPIHTSVWQVFTVPSIAGFKTPIISISGTYRQTGNPVGTPKAPYMGNESSLWGSNAIYVGGITENKATVRHIQFNAKYVIS